MGCFQVHFQTSQSDFYHKTMVAEKNNLSSKAYQNFAKFKVISKYENTNLEKTR